MAGRPRELRLLRALHRGKDAVPKAGAPDFQVMVDYPDKWGVYCWKEGYDMGMRLDQLHWMATLENEEDARKFARDALEMRGENPKWERCDGCRKEVPCYDQDTGAPMPEGGGYYTIRSCDACVGRVR